MRIIPVERAVQKETSSVRRRGLTYLPERSRPRATENDVDWKLGRRQNVTDVFPLCTKNFTAITLFFRE